MIIDYLFEDDKIIIHLFINGNRQKFTFKNHYYTKNKYGDYKDLFDERYSKVETDDIHYDKLGSNMRIPHKFALEHKFKDEDYNNTVLCIDIENHSRNMPFERKHVTNGHSEIMSIASYYYNPFLHKSKKIVHYLIPKGMKKNITFDKCEVRQFTDEVEMLRDFVKMVKYFDPDVLTGWYFDIYDINYLINRMNRLAVSPRLGRDNKVAFIKSFNEKTYVTVWGRVIFDTLSMYKNRRPKQRRKWSLDYISHFENLDSLKIDLEGTGSEKFERAWVEEPDKLIEYNLYDVLSCMELYKRDIKHYMLLQKILSCPIQETLGQNRVTSALFFKISKKDKIVMPLKKKREKVKMPGGYVYNGEKGYYEDVFVVDFVSFYPNIVRTFNLSHETYNDNNEGCTFLASGYSFRQDRRGLFSKAVDKILPFRFKFKKEFKKTGISEYDVYQKALKVLIDGAYGSHKNIHFMCYSYETCFSITTTGQCIMVDLKDYIESISGYVVGGDTDSIFFIGIDPQYVIDNYDPNSLFRKMCVGVLPKKHYIELDLDNNFTKFFQTDEKKHYFGLTKGGKMVIKGFDKSDLPAFASNFITDIFRAILDNKGIFPIGLFDKLRDDFLYSDIDQIGFPGSFPGKPEFRKGINYASEYLGLKFKPFDKPLNFRIQDSGNMPDCEWLSVNDIHDIPEDFVIDKIFMFNRMSSMALGKTVNNMRFE